MAESVSIAMPASVAARQQLSAEATAVPWYVWSAVLAVTSTTVGLYWDISWHTGIGATLSGLPPTSPSNWARC
jgi:hypothetical protein